MWHVSWMEFNYDAPNLVIYSSSFVSLTCMKRMLLKIFMRCIIGVSKSTLSKPKWTLNDVGILTLQIVRIRQIVTILQNDVYLIINMGEEFKTSNLKF